MITIDIAPSVFMTCSSKLSQLYAEFPDQQPASANEGYEGMAARKTKNDDDEVYYELTFVDIEDTPSNKTTLETIFS